jgi:hypothetical protein
MSVPRWVATITVALAFTAACSSDTIGPMPGALRVVLLTPNSDDGALLLTVSGGNIDTVEAAGYSTYTSRISPTSFRVVVAGDISAGAILTVRVPDVHASATYQATISQAASRSSFLLQNLTGYMLAVQP